MTIVLSVEDDHSLWIYFRQMLNSHLMTGSVYQEFIFVYSYIHILIFHTYSYIFIYIHIHMYSYFHTFRYSHIHQRIDTNIK